MRNQSIVQFDKFQQTTMCLYTTFDQKCHHGECQISLSIYMGSQTYFKNGCILPVIPKVQLAFLPTELELQQIYPVTFDNLQTKSPSKKRGIIQTMPSKSTLDHQKQDKFQIMYLMKKIKKDIRELKTNQSVLIDKMQQMQNEWRQFLQSQKRQRLTSR